MTQPETSVGDLVPQPAEVDEEIEAERAAAEARQEARRPKEVVVISAEDVFPCAHHPKFVKATRVFVEGRPDGPLKWHFSDFDGTEPKPVRPDWVYGPVETDEEARQKRLIWAEYDAATALWAKVAYRRQASRDLRLAAEAWPTVAAAFDRIEQAWSDLDRPPHGWKVAVKQLLDAHEAANQPVSEWEAVWAPQLARLGADLDLTSEELNKLRLQTGIELGITDIADWRIGRAVDYHGDGRFVDIEGGARDDLRNLVESQLARLKEINEAAGPGVEPGEEP